MNEYVPDIDLLCERLLAAIKPYLKAPSTAVLCSPDELRIQMNDNSYEVSGYVNSQNSYGAMIATDFTAKARYGNDNWYIDSVQVGVKTAAKNSANFMINFIVGLILCGAGGYLLYLLQSSLLDL